MRFSVRGDLAHESLASGLHQQRVASMLNVDLKCVWMQRHVGFSPEFESNRLSEDGVDQLFVPGAHRRVLGPVTGGWPGYGMLQLAALS